MELKAQTKWRWGLATYLFLSGLGAGAYVAGVFMDHNGEAWSALSKIGIILGFPCVAVAGLFKLKQLGRPQAAWRAWMRPQTSWISRGSIMLMGFLGVSFLHMILVLAGADEGVRHVLGVIGAVFAVALMFYSGILLAAARPIAFWSTAMLPVLFFVSSLLTGMMAIILIALIGGESFQGVVARLERVVAIMLVLKTLVVIFYLQSTHRTPESRASAKLVLTGAVAPLFWFGVALLGLAIPLGLGFLDLVSAYGAEPKLLAAIAAACGIAGGLFLRQIVLAAGIPAPLRAGRFEVALPII